MTQNSKEALNNERRKQRRRKRPGAVEVADEQTLPSPKSSFGKTGRALSLNASRESSRRKRSKRKGELSASKLVSETKPVQQFVSSFDIVKNPYMQSLDELNVLQRNRVRQAHTGQGNRVKQAQTGQVTSQKVMTILQKKQRAYVANSRQQSNQLKTESPYLEDLMRIYRTNPPGSQIE